MNQASQSEQRMQMIHLKRDKPRNSRLKSKQRIPSIVQRNKHFIILLDLFHNLISRVRPFPLSLVVDCAAAAVVVVVVLFVGPLSTEIDLAVDASRAREIPFFAVFFVIINFTLVLQIGSNIFKQ